jgi:polygalacturonase
MAPSNAARDFKNIVITNCVFDECRGLALESVDGSHIEDISIANITMRNIANDPIFIRLGARLRGPNGPVIGTIKRVNISNVVVSGAAGSHATTISGLPGHPVEDIHISNLRIETTGGGGEAQRAIVPPENAAKYPEPGMFGDVPAYAFYFRHVNDLRMDQIKATYQGSEARNAFVLEDVHDACFTQLDIQQGQQRAPYFDLRNVGDFSVQGSRGLKDKFIGHTVKAIKI